MNILVEKLRENNFPVLFRLNDLYNLNFDKDKLFKNYDEAVNNNWIENVYGDIYTLKEEYRGKPVSKCVLSQMIEQYSYVSLYYVLCKHYWIPEFVFSITSVTAEKNYDIETGKYGTLMYMKLYDKLPEKGIYEEKKSSGSYKIAKPLRALCDLMLLRERNWKCIDNLYEEIRIDHFSLEEDLKGEDFDELQGSFGVKNVEIFLEGIRKELKL